MKTCVYFWQYLAELILEWEMFPTKVVEKINTHILCSITFFFFENGSVSEIMWNSKVEPNRQQMII